MVHRALGRQAAGAPQLHLAHSDLIPYKKVPPEKVKLPKRSNKKKYDDQSTLKGKKFVPEIH